MRSSVVFLLRFWRGEYSLGVSYWLFGLGISLAATLFVEGVAGIVPDTYSPFAIFAAIAVTWLGLAVLSAWQAGGVWRSAAHHAARQRAAGRTLFWSRAAQTMVILGLIRLGVLIVNAGVPQLREAADMAFRNDPGIPDYALVLADDGRGIRISGGFKYGLGGELDALLGAAPAVTAIFFDSPGGRTGEAERVAGIIRARGLNTVVTDACVSACVIAFAAGRERLIGPYGRIGLHSPAFPGLTPEDIRIMQDDFAQHLLAAGFEPGFVQRGMAEPPESMWFPTRAELFAARAVTGDFADGVRDSGVVRDALLGNAVLRAMQAAEPGSFDLLMARLDQGMADGLPQADLAAIVAEEVIAVRRANAKLLLGAPDADLRAVLTLMLELHRTAYAEGGAALCNRLAVEGTGPLVSAGPVFTRIIETNGSAIFDAIGQARTKPVMRGRVTDADYQALRQEMLAAGTPEEQLTAIVDGDPANPDLCPGLIAMMDALLVMEGDGGERMRAVFVSDVAAE